MSNLQNPHTLNNSCRINSWQIRGSAKEFWFDTQQMHGGMSEAIHHKLAKSGNFIHHVHKPHCPLYLSSKIVCWCCLFGASNWGFRMVLGCIREAWSWAWFATCKYTGASTFCCISHVFTTFAWKIALNNDNTYTEIAGYVTIWAPAT